ncbi:STAS domain-containing protein [Blastococcus sp. PRF04-17]|uniref:STAS domain-containing protein n=1 Tax=Blastococcus sp. PRF04-17 TaxID=2933797 RepID=UPI001FF64D16|nr:STAS domain-containing protein [Blastococcus sp. PRF04-17]UOY03608.1 STAS domain-containing protein [Blastococcus sp. PRF04-17]
MTAHLDLTRWPAEPGPPPFLLSIDVAKARVSLHGELDREAAHRLDEAIGVLVHTASPRWSVDVSAVRFCDAEGLRALVRAQQRAQRAGRVLVVERPGGCLRRLLPLVGIDPAGPHD